MPSTFAVEVADGLDKDRVRLQKIIERFIVIKSTDGLTADEHDTISEAADTLELILGWNR